MTQRTLLAVATCAKPAYALRAISQQETWGAESVPQNMDVKWFCGNVINSPLFTTPLDCGDEYTDLPQKTLAIIRYALDHGYTHLVKCDDDVYLDMDRLAAAVPDADYSGRVRLASNRLPAAYCSGFCYWLSRRAMKAVLEHACSISTRFEDVMVGNALLKAGILPVHDTRYQIISSPKRSIETGGEGPRSGNDIIAVCELPAERMRLVHKEKFTMESKGGYEMAPTGTPFDRVDVLIKTFLRDGMMLDCVRRIQAHMPGARMIIVDDGYHSVEKRAFYNEIELAGHIIRFCPFDTGYGAKMNIGQAAATREFTLRIADDFMFDATSAAGVIRLIGFLDDPQHADYAIASGRVDGNPYEANFLFNEDRSEIHLLRVHDPGNTFTECDMTVNYSLIRTPFLQSFKWDEEFKIGGDHLDLYLFAQAVNKKVAYVHGVDVATKKNDRSTHPDYPYFRGRARLALPWSFKRNGFKRMVLMDGTVDTAESVQAWVDAYDAVKPLSSNPGSKAEKDAAILAARAARLAASKAKKG